jgi:hypothetical protein
MNQSKQESSEKTSCSHRRKLPAELNREIYLSFNTNSTQIHLWIGMGFLFNVPAKTTQKGFFCYL